MITVAGTLLGAAQSYSQHNSALETAEKNTTQQLEQSVYYNKKHLEQNKDHHTVQYTHALNAARREALRDMWAQANQKNQTQIIMQTLLFGCCFGLLIEGLLPQGTVEPLVCLYGICLSLAIMCIFISLLCLVKVQSRMTRFNISNREQVYRCGRQYANFGEYYKAYCQSLKGWARCCNHVGMTLLFVTGVVLWYCRFMYAHSSLAAAIIFATINSITLIGIIVIVVCVKTKTRADSTNISDSHPTPSQLVNIVIDEDGYHSDIYDSDTSSE